MERAIMCPQCNAPLTPHRFARSIVCAYCGATVFLEEETISASKFHEAFQIWNTPETYGTASWISIGDNHWSVDRLLSAGETCDVFAGRRARWPTELVVLKAARKKQDTPLLEREWEALKQLQASETPGGETFLALIPQPVRHGISTGGLCIGQTVNIYRWASGFYHTAADVINAYPQGIPPRASIWIWRRILELLSFIHTSNMAHGAIVPSHLLIQENDHGVRLVGFSRAGRKGQSIEAAAGQDKKYYPDTTQMEGRLSNQLDIVMSARCIIALLGGNPADGSIPDTVPELLVNTIRRTAMAKSNDPDCQDAWAIREELGHIANMVFGPPQFIPIIMPNH
ncbi:MAG: hypothetical protein GX577_09640 [Leptolinea sp.]|nr:hypothetical protein [Leptolinea sp.]